MKQSNECRVKMQDILPVPSVEDFIKQFEKDEQLDDQEEAVEIEKVKVDKEKVEKKEVESVDIEKKKEEKEIEEMEKEDKEIEVQEKEEEPNELGIILKEKEWFTKTNDQ
jgi:hypothetical protein